MSFVLIFDIPLELQTLKRQVNRKLVRLGAEQVQRSVWKFNDLSQLTDIAIWIKSSGGDARILQEKFVF